MENLFSEVKKFVVVLETDIYAIKPMIVKEREDMDNWFDTISISHEGENYEVFYDIPSRYFLPIKEKKTKEILKKVRKEFEFSHVLCDFENQSLLRILGYMGTEKVWCQQLPILLDKIVQQCFSRPSSFANAHVLPNRAEVVNQVYPKRSFGLELTRLNQL